MASTYYKTAAKTAKENGWTLADSWAGSKVKRVFNFALLDSMDIPDDDKQVIRDDAIKCISVVNRDCFYGHAYNGFRTIGGTAAYALQAVYAKDGRRLYNVLHLIGVAHTQSTRKSVYDDWTYSETKAVSDKRFYGDIEIE